MFILLLILGYPYDARKMAPETILDNFEGASWYIINEIAPTDLQLLTVPSLCVFMCGHNEHNIDSYV